MKRWPAIAVCLVSCCAVAQQKPGVFPMQKGTTWVYQAHVKAAQPDSSAVLEKNLRWTMTAEDSAVSGNISAVLLRGGPWDLAWYQPDVEPGMHAVVRVGDSYYLLHASDAVSTVAEIKTGKITEPEELLADDIWFRMPMRPDDHFCAPQMESHAPMYCWNLEAVTTDANAHRTEYRLIFRTNPDHEIVTLAPGVGITAWEYVHHGTTAEVSLKLIEFRAPKQPAGVPHP